MLLLVCPCGNRSKKLEPTGIEECSARTGFRPIYTYTFDGRIIWLCPVCFDKANNLAEDILKIVGTENIHFSFLLKDIRANSKEE